MPAMAQSLLVLLCFVKAAHAGDNECPTGQVFSQGMCQCDAGWIYTSAAGGCTPCEPGRYKKWVGRFTCDYYCSDTYGNLSTSKSGAASIRDCECVPGAFKKRKEAGMRCEKCPPVGVTCPGGKVNFFGVTFDRMPEPIKGYYIIDKTTGEAIPCPEGMHCPGGSIAPTLLPGFWASEEAPSEVYLCGGQGRFSDDAPCPGGPLGTCAPSHHGLACAECDSGHYWVNGACLGCSVGMITFAIAALSGVAGVSLVYSLWLRIEAGDDNRARLIMKMLGDFLLLLQVVAVTGQVHPVLGFVVYDPHALGMKCVAESSVVGYMFAMLGCPIGLHGIAVLVHVMRSCRLTNEVRGSAHKKTHASLLFGMLISWCYVAMNPLRCYSHPNGTQSLVSAPSILCWDSESDHMQLVIAAAVTVAVLLIAVGIACAMDCFGKPVGYFLFRLRESESRPGAPQFLYPLMIILRNISLLLIPLMLPSSPVASGALSSVVTLVILAVFLYWRPQRFALLDDLEICTCMTLCVISFILPRPVPLASVVLWAVVVAVLMTWKRADVEERPAKQETEAPAIIGARL
eukprot:TRINITY_DN2963_c4_g1_i1.p1 TRINITY_DN2963_c4_g1~~TRINITY_DN2963_c4_g1_i1.p1  ORF type:complete len:571 (+),score=56.83 TRINITY_DN2963_c4_g1_i1:74-1786(+)